MYQIASCAHLQVQILSTMFSFHLSRIALQVWWIASVMSICHLDQTNQMVHKSRVHVDIIIQVLNLATHNEHCMYNISHALPCYLLLHPVASCKHVCDVCCPPEW